MNFRWPFKKIKQDKWVGINLSESSPGIVLRSQHCVEHCTDLAASNGELTLDKWIDKQLPSDTPAVLVLDEKQYELLLVEAPDVPEEELTAAVSFRIGDLLSQPLEEMTIQAFRLPPDAYRGRMSMAYVVASPKETIRELVDWSKKRKLDLKQITVPEMCLLQVLAAHDNAQNSAILELKENHGIIRLYSDGALYLTRQVEVGFAALGFSESGMPESVSNETSSPAFNEELNKELNEELGEIELETSDEDQGEEVLLNELDLDEVILKENQAIDAIDQQQTENLILEIQRSLDYYESQLGMGQISNLWVFSEQVDLSLLCEKIKPMLHTNAKQLDLNSSIPKAGIIDVAGDCEGLDKSLITLGGALSYAGN